MGKSKMDNTEKLAAYGRQGEDKHNTRSINHSRRRHKYKI
jgi:hypothetical protein